jgi:hypothetical protein
MDDEIELISDGDGLAIIGDPTAVDRFIKSLELSPDTKSDRLGSLLTLGSIGLSAGALIAANSGSWLKLTEESAAAIKNFGLTPTKTPGISYAMIGAPGDIAKWVEVVSPTLSMVTNPAFLAGAAGIMMQLTMKDQMDAITDYLAIIDAKLDGVIRSQTNQVLARIDGVDLAIREARSIRDSVGRVSDVTWSKVQGSVQSIHETMGYSLRQIADVADKIENSSKIADLMKMTQEAASDIQKWLVVLARCFELLDAIGILELDRVLDASPEELDSHRVGLKSARREQLDYILERTDYLLIRTTAAVNKANSNVLFNPVQSPAVIKSCNQVVSMILDLRTLLGIVASADSSQAIKWTDAASVQWDKVRGSSAEGVDVAKKLGSAASGHAQSAKQALSSRFAGLKVRTSKAAPTPSSRDESGDK